MPKYDTHHLNLEETWYVRDHPYDIKVVAVKRLVRALDIAEAEAAVARQMLEKAIAEMNERRESGK